MLPDLKRVLGSVADASRQPPAFGPSFLPSAHHEAVYQFRRSPGCVRPHIRLKRGTHIARGAPGNHGSPQRGDNGDDSNGRQSTETRWWQQVDLEQSEDSELQQERGQQPGQVARFGTARPVFSSSQRTQDGISSSPRLPDPNRIRAAATSEGSTGSYSAVDSRPAANVLLPPPSSTAGAPPGSPSPHSRALGFLSTLASVVAVGAYVYTLVTRKKGEQSGATGSMGQSQGMGGFGPPPADAKRASAGSGLFRSPKAPPAPPSTSAAAAAGAATAPAVMTPTATAAAAVAATATSTAAKAATGQTSGIATAPRSAVAVAGPVQPPASPARELGWWRRLGRLYYISFGAQYGLVPQIRLEGATGAAGGSSSSSSSGRSLGIGGSSSSGGTLVAFEDPADAEFVANVLWEDLVESEAESPGPRPPTVGVMSAAPMFLEDLAAMRGLQVEAVPSEGLRKDLHLGGAQLEAMLAALVRGASPEAAAVLAEQVLAEAAAVAAANDTAAAAAAAAAASLNENAPTVDARRGGGGAAAAAAPPGASRLPLELAAERQGIKIKLPSKFDFPGFDSNPTPRRGDAVAAAAPAAGAAAVEPLAAEEPPAQVPAARLPAEASRAKRGHLDTVAPAAAAPIAATAPLPPPPTAPALPQVEASAVREPVPGRVDVSDDVRFGGDADLWAPYGARVIDAEAVDVTPASTSAPVSPPPSARNPQGGLTSTSPPETGSTAGSGAGSTAVHSTEVDEAMREYRELQSLFAMAADGGGGGGGVAAAASPPQPTAVLRRAADAWDAADAAVSGAASGAPVQESHGPREAADAVEPQLQQQQRKDSEAREDRTPARRRSGVEAAKEILEKQGPTDAALEAALAAMEEEEYRTDEDLLDEYYSIFDGPKSSNRSDHSSSNGVSSSSSSSHSTSNGSSGSGSTWLKGGAASAAGSSSAAAPSGVRHTAHESGLGNGDIAAAIAEVQQQLASVVQAVAAAHARGVPPPADAAATMKRLQGRLQDLQSRLKPAGPAAADASTAAAAAPRPTAAATAPRQAGSLFSAPASFRPVSSNSNSSNSSRSSSSTNSNGSIGAVNIGSSSSNGVSRNAATEPQKSEVPDPAALVTPLHPAGTTANGSSAATAAAAQAADGGKAGARRAWGAWKTNRRIQAAEATLLKTATSAATLPPAQHEAATRRAAGAPPPPPLAATGAARAGGNGGGGGAAASPDNPRKDAVAGAEEDGVKVLSKRVGTNRPPKVVEAPEARQDRVKEALRVFSEMGGDMGDEDDEGEGDGLQDDQLFGRSASLMAGGRKPWWQQRFQVLFLPTIGYPDGSIGFVQVNVSLAADKRDMRVLAFEDRTDCTACLTLMAQWPDYDDTEPRLSMMPTDQLLSQLQSIYDEQSDLNSSVSRPRGLAVFRRGKLPMRPGMGPEDFLQLVVYQYAAQVALARTGYGFDA